MHFLFTTSANFSATLQWLVHNGYPIMFVAMVVEGPMVIMASSFAASLGVFNVFVIFVLAVLGDLVGDLILYSLGYFSRIAIVNKYGHFFGATPERMDKVKKFLELHPLKTLTAIKLSPFIPVPALIVVGSTHISPKKYASAVLMIILPKTILFMTIGYFFGNAYEKIAVYLNNSLYAIAIIMVAAFVIFLAYRKISDKASKWLEKS